MISADALRVPNFQTTPCIISSPVGYNIYIYHGIPMIFAQCEAPKIAKLVPITPITMVYGTQITIVTGANLNQLITGGPHIA